jgi:hypothetical protein
MWCFFGYSSPDTHPRISEKERLFLRQQVPQRSAKVTKENQIRDFDHIHFLFQESCNTMAKNCHLWTSLWYCYNACLL